MGFNFQKQSQYSRHQIYQTVTGTEDSPNFDMGQTGYGRIDSDLFIFMNIGIPGADGMDYKNHYFGLSLMGDAGLIFSYSKKI